MKQRQHVIKVNNAILAESFTTREASILRLLAKGLTNQEIARDLALALETVKWYNKRIYTKLQVANRTQAVSRSSALGLLKDSDSTQSSSPALSLSTGNIPAPLTSFVGRRRETAEALRLLDGGRLLTLTGPAGSGKTRLALQLATGKIASFEDGAYFIPLGAVSTAENMWWAIAEKVHFQFQPNAKPVTQLLNFFGDKRLLLILDTFEHLLAESRLVIDILRVAPEVKILVTSREQLNLYGEIVYRVDGLCLPERVEEAAQAEAVTLFLERAQAVQPTMALDNETLAAAARICRLVGGLPLAIELVASWVGVLPSSDIADQLEASLDLLAIEPRHGSFSASSMGAAFARSWDLLNESERAAFQTLAVFQGGFTRHAAERAAGVDLPTLTALVRKSLLYFTPETGRYAIHELLGRYARGHLDGSDEAPSVRAAHAAYFAEFMNRRWPLLKGPDQANALLEVGADIQNVRAAWNYWLGQANVVELKKFFHSLWVVHDFRGWYRSGMTLFEQGVAGLQAVTGDDARAARAWLLAVQGQFTAAGGGSVRQGFTLAQQAVQILDELHRRQELLIPLISLAITAVQMNAMGTAIQAASRCAAVAATIGDIWVKARANQLLARCAMEDGNLRLAERLGHDALAIFAECGDAWSESTICTALLGPVAVSLRHFDQARYWTERGLQGRRVPEPPPNGRLV